MKSQDQQPNKSSGEQSQNRRRDLLKLLALSTGMVGQKVFSGEIKNIDDSLMHASKMLEDRVHLNVYRPEDLLELEMVFTGFQLGADGRSIRKTSTPNLLHVYFSPQSIAEQAFEEAGQPGEMVIENKQQQNIKGNEKAIFQNQEFQLPAKTYLSERSRLVFSIPADINTIQLSAEALLNWDKYTLLVTKRAASPKAMPLFGPDDTVEDFKNVLLKDAQQKPDLDDAMLIPVQTGNLINNKQTDPPGNNIFSQSDLSRQAQLNKDIRSATRTEQQQIQENEMPAGILLNTNVAQVNPTIFNFKIGKTPRPLDADETCIEMPFRLFLSPNEYGTWFHEHKLKYKSMGETGFSKTVELWHTRLTCKNCNGGKDLSDVLKPIRSVRAVWATDINGDYREKPVRKDGFKTSLYNDDRHCIVHESSNWALPNKFVPQPVMINNLMMTTLGAWLDAELNVKRTSLESAGVIGNLNLLKWKHIATMARDHYVEVVYAGNIFPFGHEASLVRITQRRPQRGYAINRQRYFIAISEEEKKYDPYDPDNGDFRKFNFSTIRFITTSTPTIDPPTVFCNDVRSQNDHQFVPKVNGKDFMFKILGFDLEGNELHFEMPLVFLSTDVTRNSNAKANTGNISRIANFYNRSTLGKQIDFRNQKMALARSQTKGDTLFELKTISFHATLAETDSSGFHPICKELDIYINAVENLLGKRVSQVVELIDDEQNKSESSRKNKGKVFAKLIQQVAVDFAANADKIGSGLTPNFSITALSKSMGAIGGEIDDALDGDFDPMKFFAASAKLFGVIDLSRIIKAVNNATAVVNGENIQSPIPALKNIETKEAFITQYSWNGASLKAHDFGFVKFKPKSGAAGKLKIETKLKRYKDPSKSMLLTMDSHIDDFSVEVASIAAVNFKRVGFKVDSSAKLDFSVDMAQEPIRFMGALTFVNDLQRFIPSDGFSDPPFLDVTPNGVLSGYTLGLPDIQLGVFTLRNINLGASIRLPFDGSPMVLRFNFCERQQPFNLTVSALGGGGFFALEFDMNGLRSIDAALEFGAAISLDLGVASGAVTVMGGIYFRMVVSDGSNEYELQGYIRINGALSVLGLITVSVEFLLALSAELERVNGEDKVSRVWGEANLRVKVEVFMFSKTVSMRVQRQFAGAGADPTFGMLISNDEWLEYCDAFAA